MLEPISERHPVEKLAEEFIERFRRGERPALTEYTDRHPELADEIRDVFPALVMMEDVRPDGESIQGRFGSGPILHPGQKLERLAEYRILREVGRGGMGIVYEAEQETLGRRVALKVLPFERLNNPSYLERFRREAKAAARLHHTNIVPVFGVGESDGVHFFAMQFIHGEPLDRVLSDLRRLRGLPGVGDGQLRDKTAKGLDVTQSLLTGRFENSADVATDAEQIEGHLSGDSSGVPNTGKAESVGSSSLTSTSQNTEQEYFRSVSRIGVQAAEALEYAHRQGILHRDIKPSNLLLDTAGVVWVTDFGLARAEGSDDLTGVGEILGTLGYMGPERFQGKSDRRSDVYSLGVTLYELLTLRPAFQASDRVHLIRRISDDEPVRPRQIRPEIPRDLETIVLRAIEKDPGHRYPTAEDMAEDLRRYLADRPIRARRTSAAERAWRWCRRNPAVAMLLTSVLGILLASGIGGTVLSIQRGAALEQAVQADREKTDKLWLSYLEQARAARMSGRPGQRFDALRAIRNAAAIKITPELSHEAAAALVLPDVEVAHEWEGYPEGTIGLDFDASFEKYARVNRDGRVTVCRRTESGEEVLTSFQAPGEPAYHPWMSPNGGWLAVMTSRARLWRSVCVWRLGKPSPEVVLEAPIGPHGLGIDFSPDSRWLAVGQDGAITVWDLETGRQRQNWKVESLPYHLAFHPRDGRLAAACGNDARIFNVHTGQELLVLQHSKIVSCVAWHPDGRRLATGCDDLNIHMWDVESGREVMTPWAHHRQFGTLCTFNRAGDRLLSGDWTGQMVLSDVATGRALLETPGTKLRFSPDDSLLGYATNGKNVRLIRVARNGGELRTFRRANAGSREQIVSPVVERDGRILAAVSFDPVQDSQWLCFFDLASGEELASIAMPGTYAAWPAERDPSGGWLTSGTTGVLHWPVHKSSVKVQKSIVLTHDFPHLSPASIQIGPPQLLASATNRNFGSSRDNQVLAFPALAWGNQVTVVDRRRIGRRVTLEPHYDARYTAVSPDGRWVATGSHTKEQGVRIWEAESGRHVHDLPFEMITPVFSPDGRWLATTTGDACCQLWEVGSWKKGPLFRTSRMPVSSFSPDGRLIALPNESGAIQLNEVASGRVVAMLTAPNTSGCATYDFGADGTKVNFSADGTKLIAVAAGRDLVYAFDLPLIRRQLKAMGLDWDWPEFPAEQAQERPRSPLAVKLDPGFMRPPLITDDRLGIAVYSLLLATNAINPDVILQRGQAHARLNQPKEAIADYSTFLALAPVDDSRRVEVLCRRAANYDKLQDFDGALVDLLQLANVAPERIPFPSNVATLCNNTVWRRVKSPTTKAVSTEVLTLCQKAVALEPANVMFQNTLGVTLYRMERFQDAVHCLEANLQAPNKWLGFDLYILAMCHHRLGDARKARDCFDRAVRWCDERKGLSQMHLDELNAFRAEAEALGVVARE
jgi:serine/threonine protein kinase/WD40 repeat protein/tetratricopeptide (TPR) repeat protein